MIYFQKSKLRWKTEIHEKKKHFIQREIMIRKIDKDFHQEEAHATK